MTLSHPVSHFIIHAHTVDTFFLDIWTAFFKRKIYFLYFVRRDNSTEYLLCHVRAILSEATHFNYFLFVEKCIEIRRQTHVYI